MCEILCNKCGNIILGGVNAFVSVRVFKSHSVRPSLKY